MAKINVDKMLSVINDNIKEFFFNENQQFKYLKATEQGYFLDKESLGKDFKDLTILKKEQVIGNTTINFFNSTKVLGPGVIVVNQDIGAAGIFYSVSIGVSYYFDSIFSANGVTYQEVFQTNIEKLTKINNYALLVKKIENPLSNTELNVLYKFYKNWTPKINTTVAFISESSIHQIEGWNDNIEIEEFDDLLKEMIQRYFAYQTIEADPKKFKEMFVNKLIMDFLLRLYENKSFFDWNPNSLINLIKSKVINSISKMKIDEDSSLQTVFFHSNIKTIGSDEKTIIFKTISFIKASENEVFYLDLFSEF